MQEPIDSPDQQPEQRPEQSPETGRTSVPGAGDVVAEWRRQLAAFGGADPLTRYRDLPDGTLDLASAHPSGLAMFLAGRPTRLSSLFREPGVLTEARRRARSVRLTATILADEHGLDAGHLAVGMVTWPGGDADEPGERITAPVLLRPLTLRPRGAGQVDYDLDLGDSVIVNPALVRALAARGVTVDPGELVRLADGQGFDPGPAFERLLDVARPVSGFALTPRLVVGTFVDLAPALVAELDRLVPTAMDDDRLAALAGDVRARNRLRTHRPAPGDAAAVPDAHVVPLDGRQRAVVEAVLSGRSVRVEAPPGTGATQVVVALLAALTATGRRTLLVTGQRAEARDVRAQLDALGLARLVDPDADLPEQQPRTSRTSAGDAVRALRRRHEAVHAPRPPWGVSALAAMQELARLTSAPTPPRTSVRLAPDVLRRLDRATRDVAADALRRAAEGGAFRLGAGDTPWFGAELTGEEEAAAVLTAIGRLRSELLPRLRTEMGRVQAEAGLAAASTVGVWGRQLDLLVGVRDTLDVFTPAIYERPVGEMVTATAPDRRSGAMGGRERRRWEKQARELLRPGTRPDLHPALVAAHDQRQLWQQMSAGGGWPRVPAGLADVDDTYVAAVDELLHLERVLAGTPDGGALLDADLAALDARLERLAADPDSLDTLPRRAAALSTLRSLGLDPLVADLRSRSCPAGQVTAELELAWWRSLLQQLLADDPDLRDVDASRHDADVAALEAAERERRASVVRRVSDVLGATGPPPCRATSPLALPHDVPADAPVDVVVLAGAHRIGVAEGVLALARARQVVVVGDPGGLPPATVLLHSDDAAEAGEPAEARPDVLAELAGALPTWRLDEQHRMPAQLCRPGDVVLAPEKSASSQARVPAPPDDALVVLDLVPDGVGHPGADGGVESVDAEVRRVVELVLQHARTRPEESLAVVAVTRVHARLVADALRADLPDHPDVARWLASAPEPFVVTDVQRAEDAVRDAVLLAVSFGRTPHGRVLHRFGVLDADAGDRALAVALTRARRRLTVVSSLRAEDLDPERLRTPGARALRAVLADLEAPEDPGDVDADLPPLLADLARRLAAHDLSLAAGPTGGPDLVVRDGSRGRTVGVLTDLPPLADDAALLERELALPARLRTLGWPVARLRAVALFSDPNAAVRRIIGT